jgi:hypothetical protein
MLSGISGAIHMARGARLPSRQLPADMLGLDENMRINAVKACIRSSFGADFTGWHSPGKGIA